MGKKSTPDIPEPYKLEELLKASTDMNRFDSYNPFGSQTWDEGSDGRWSMTQAINPEFQGLMDKQLDFVNRGPNRIETPGPMKDTYQALMDKRSQVWGGTPGYHPDVQGGQPQSMMPGAAAESQGMPGRVSEDPGATLVRNESMMPGSEGRQSNSLGIGAGYVYDPNDPRQGMSDEPSRFADFGPGGSARAMSGEGRMNVGTGQMGPPAPTEETKRMAMADAMSKMGDIKGNEWASLGGNVRGAIDRYRSRQ